MRGWFGVVVLGVALVAAPPAAARDTVPIAEPLERCCQPLTLPVAKRAVVAWARHYDDATLSLTRCRRLSPTVIKCHPVATDAADPFGSGDRVELIVYSDVTVTLRRGIITVHDTWYVPWRVPRRFL